MPRLTGGRSSASEPLSYKALTWRSRNLSCGDELMETSGTSTSTLSSPNPRNLSCGDELMETH